MLAPVSRPGTAIGTEAAKSAMRVNVKLSGRWGLPEVESELRRGPVELDLPEAVTGHALLQCLAERYGSRFARKALKTTGTLRAEVRVFVGDEQCDDLGAPIDEQLRRGAEVVIALLAPLIGG